MTNPMEQARAAVTALGERLRVARLGRSMFRETRPTLWEVPAYAQALAAIDGKGLKLRYQRDGRGFAVTERLAALGSGIGWYCEGEIAIIGQRRSGGQWRIRHYDGRTWARPDAVIEDDQIEATVAGMIGARP